ncbi:MAG: hypothetical protein QNJ90_05085 [Planctomycetota bacterium]|nr:hypothetical protein [Planctomycetota bacterium]
MVGKNMLPLVAAMFALFLGGCGAPSEQRSMEMVVSSSLVQLSPDATTSARGFAQTQGKHLGPGGWTYHSGAGKLPLPKDFKDAFLALGKAWAAAAPMLPEDRNLAQALEADEPTWRAAFASIDAAYAHARSMAEKHGVRAPGSWIRR